MAELPRSLNPSKGYIVAANNRNTPDTAKYDHGTEATPTARAYRITEMIEERIAAGKKFTVDGIIDIMQDQIDTIARKQAPLMVQIAESAKSELTSD